MVLAPSLRLPGFMFLFAAFCIASKSKPWWMRKRWSSLAITATGRCCQVTSNCGVALCFRRFLPVENILSPSEGWRKRVWNDRLQRPESWNWKTVPAPISLLKVLVSSMFVTCCVINEEKRLTQKRCHVFEFSLVICFVEGQSSSQMCMSRRACPFCSYFRVPALAASTIAWLAYM